MTSVRKLGDGQLVSLATAVERYHPERAQVDGVNAVGKVTQIGAPVFTLVVSRCDQDRERKCGKACHKTLIARLASYVEHVASEQQSVRIKAANDIEEVMKSGILVFNAESR